MANPNPIFRNSPFNDPIEAFPWFTLTARPADEENVKSIDWGTSYHLPGRGLDIPHRTFVRGL
jgi:hypothetical protein